jgi:hypothetical protein
MTARPASTILAAALVLSACSVHTHDNDGNTDASITIGNTGVGNGGGNSQSVSINVPGFSAKVNVPDLALGTDTTKIDDLKIFPGTKVNGVKITGQASDGSGGDSKGNVEMGFTAPADPAKIVDWYRGQAQQQGWTIVPPSGANQFQATKQEGGHDATQFALQVASATGGSSGRFFVTGH